MPIFEVVAGNRKYTSKEMEFLTGLPVMPVASEQFYGHAYIYTGTTDENFSIGHLYFCQRKGTEGAYTYAWEDISTTKNGLSAYELSVEKGFEGTVDEWLLSLKGEKGDSFTFDDFTDEQLEIIRGAQGPQGPKGDPGDPTTATASDIPTTTAGVSVQDALDESTRPNKLHNWYFKNPVNQRNISGAFSTAGAYFIDRWKLINGSVTLTANGLTLNGTIVQILEYAMGNGMFASVKMYSGDAAATYDDATKTFSITSSGGTIESAKLEKGSSSTLANDPPMDYGKELTTCQRYCMYYAGDTTLPISQFSTSIIWGNIFVTAPMRIVPTIAGGTIKMYGNGSTLTTENTGWGPLEFFSKGNCLYVRNTKASHGFNGENISMRASNLLLSADL